MISDVEEEEAKESRTSGGKSGLKPILETWSQSSEAVAAWKHKNMAWIADKGLCDVCLFTLKTEQIGGFKEMFNQRVWYVDLSYYIIWAS